MSTTQATAGINTPIDPGALPAVRGFMLSHEARSSHHLSLVIIDTRSLQRECLAQSLVGHGIGMDVLAFGSIEEWKSGREEYAPLAALLLNLRSRKVTDEGTAEEIRKLSTEFAKTPVIVLADTDELTQIMKALECGAVGYIPSSVGIDVCVEVIKLALAGGIFVPASSVFAMRRLLESGGEAGRQVNSVFTDRQAEVVEALRRGKPNKIIAYELKLRESTVKVHIRNIMKKMKATNRTEVVYKINDLLFSGNASESAMNRPAAALL